MRYGGLIIAIVVAAIAAFAVLKMAGNEKPAPTPEQPAAQQSKTVNVYIAAKPITIGTAITEDMIAVQPWPEHLTVEGFVVADGKNNVVGMVARGQYQQNEPLMMSKLANPSDPNFLAGELPAGMRVVTIPINEVDGIAGFVFPGDHVDLIFTHDVDKWVTSPTGNTNRLNGLSESQNLEKIKVTVTETLLTNVKVLAVDQRATGAGSTDKNGNLVIPRSASLMVSQTDSQRVRLAQKTGTVSMVLRALADREASDPLVLTAPKDISQSKQQDEEDIGNATDDSSVKIVRGAPKNEKEVESTGTQTSRGSPTSSGLGGGVLPPSMPSGNSIINPGLVAIP